MTVGTTPQDGVNDRRRAREERGYASAAAPTGDRLPRAPRERRPMLAVLAVLLIVGGAAVAGLVALRQDTRVPVLALAVDVPAGTEITEQMLTTLPVAAENTLLVPASQQDQVVGRYARLALAQGQLLDTSMLTDSGLLRSGTVAVGGAFQPGRMPASGLQPGDVVQLVNVADPVAPSVVVADARVSSVKAAESTSMTAATVVTFVVDAAQGAPVASLAASGDLAVVLVSRGTPVGSD